MDTNDTLPTNRVRVLRLQGGQKFRESEPGAISEFVDDESPGFDPYDTASLFVATVDEKTADQS